MKAQIIEMLEIQDTIFNKKDTPLLEESYLLKICEDCSFNKDILLTVQSYTSFVDNFIEGSIC